MQCAPIAATVFALRQAFAVFASGKILGSLSKIASAIPKTRWRPKSAASAANRSHVQLRLLRMDCCRLEQLDRNTDRAPDRERQRGENGGRDDHYAYQVAGANGGRRGNGTKIVKARDMAANAGEPQNEIERERRHNLSPEGNDQMSPWLRSRARTLSERKVSHPKTGIWCHPECAAPLRSID